MSTRQDAAHESTAPNVDETTDFSDRTRRHEPPPTDRSWTALCQSQFSATDTSRLSNLADGDNEAMPDGV
jgi:hypothetical protein